MRRFPLILVLGTGLFDTAGLAAQSCIQAPLRTGERAIALRPSWARSTWQVEAAWLQRSVAAALSLNAGYAQIESGFFNPETNRSETVSGHQLQMKVALALPLGLLGVECVGAAASIGGSRISFQNQAQRSNAAIIQFSLAWSPSPLQSANGFLIPYLAPDLDVGRVASTRNGTSHSDDFLAAVGGEAGVLVRTGRIIIVPSVHWSVSTLEDRMWPAASSGTVLALRLGLVM